MMQEEYQELRATQTKYYMALASTDQELIDTFSDYHKDTYGFRPKLTERPTRQTVCELLAALDGYHAVMRETFAGREQLRAEGWVIEEADPVQQAMADALAARREEGQIEDHKNG